MHDSLTNIAIAWTSDLEDFHQELENAVLKCAHVFPGCRFHIIGITGLSSESTTADNILRTTVHMNRNLGWTISSFEALTKLHEVSRRDCDRAYNHIIFFTRQVISRFHHNSPFDSCSHENALISLAFCRNLIDLENVATLMLKHTIGHFYISTVTEAHCHQKDCSMSPMYSHRHIYELAEHEQNPNLDSFCPDCVRKLVDSPLWKTSPSIVIKR